MKIIIKYTKDLVRSDLLPYGRIITDLAGAHLLFLETQDDTVLELVRGVEGIVYAELDERRPVEKVMQSAWAGAMGDFNRFIYQELDVEAAWAITKGDPRVKIAVLDSGCDTRHPNLTVKSGGVIQNGTFLTAQRFPMKIDVLQLVGNRILFQVVTIAAYECVDSRFDGSPLVPVTCYGDSACTIPLFTGQAPYEVANLITYFWVDRPIDVYFEFEEDPDTSVQKWILGMGIDAMRDLYGHGTACCGVVNGQHDGSGVPGIAPDCSTIAYKVYSDEDWFYVTDLISGVYHAVNDGCHIISFSISSSDIFPGEAEIWQYALDNGVIFVAAAANSGKTPQTNTYNDIYCYPASYPGVISVGGVGDRISQTDAGGFIDSDPTLYDYTRMCFFTQKNDRVFICAPGDGWRLHVPMNFGMMWQLNNRTQQYVTEYTCQSESGTSFATPATAAGIGLMLSKKLIGFASQDPAEVKAFLAASASPSLVKQTIINTAKLPVKLSNGGTATGGYGHGRFSIGAAVVAI